MNTTLVRQGSPSTEHLGQELQPVGLFVLNMLALAWIITNDVLFYTLYLGLNPVKALSVFFLVGSLNLSAHLRFDLHSISCDAPYNICGTIQQIYRNTDSASNGNNTEFTSQSILTTRKFSVVCRLSYFRVSYCRISDVCRLPVLSRSWCSVVCLVVVLSCRISCRSSYALSCIL